MAFFALKISDPNSVDIVNNIRAGGDNIVISQLNQLRAELVADSFVFIQLGGDRVTWPKGLIGLAAITRPPFDDGYDTRHPNNFRMGLSMRLVLANPIKREAFKFYPNAYDAAGIGPNTRGEQNQAIKSLTNTQAYTIIRAMVDNQPALEAQIMTLFENNETALNSIFGRIPFLVEQSISHEEYLNNQNDDDNEHGLIISLAEYESATLAEREAFFTAWMQTLVQNNGEPYASGTISNYITSLRTCLSHVPELNRVDSFFSCSSYEELMGINSLLTQSASYATLNDNNHNRYSSSVLLYGQFLLGLNSNLNNRATGGFNKIFYGAPGCGKSRYVEDMLKAKHVPKENKFRVTFHPEYMNCDFVGQIVPKVYEERDLESGNVVRKVNYEFNPGPFTQALLRSYKTSDMVYLIIEEINRGNAAAIFGDIFQLLDRVKSTDDGVVGRSEVTIRNSGITDYFMTLDGMELVIEDTREGIYIPSNLTILATMNSSDQNVFTMDTAFKRRWLFEQISNDITRDNDHPYKGWFVPGTDVTWETFLTKINNEILNYKIQNQTNEDKRLGKYFIGKECLTEDENNTDAKVEAQNFAYKIFEYLWNDVCKIGREEWFDIDKYKTLEDLIDAFVEPEDNEPLSVFRKIEFRG